MHIDGVINSIAMQLPLGDTQAFEMDLYSDVIDLCGKRKRNRIPQKPIFTYSANPQSHVNITLELGEEFKDVQTAEAVGLVIISNCCYREFRAVETAKNKTELIIRFVTANQRCYFTGTLIISGKHYEQLFEEHLAFLERWKTARVIR